MKIIKQIIPYAVILILVVLIRSFIVTPVIVSGESMDDTLKDGNILLLKKYDKNYERFDIVVFDYQDSMLVKRIIGLPGDHIRYQDGILYINDEIVEDKFASDTFDYDLEYLSVDVIPEGYYFVLGDNRMKSSDSRIIGLISEKDISGTTSFSLWPFKSFE